MRGDSSRVQCDPSSAGESGVCTMFDLTGKKPVNSEVQLRNIRETGAINIFVLTIEACRTDTFPHVNAETETYEMIAEDSSPAIRNLNFRYS